MKKLCIWLLKIVVMLTKVTHKAGIKTDGCFRTFTGKKFNILNPTFEMIHPEDIIRGLAHKPHYSGFSPQFFSIAEHSLLVCEFYEMCNPYDYKGQLQALLHDASEAYTGDMIKPIKNLLPNFVMIENIIQSTIYAKYSINPDERKLEVKRLDNRIQDIEADAFYHYDYLEVNKQNVVDKWIKYLSPTDAYYSFWKKYNELIELAEIKV